MAEKYWLHGGNILNKSPIFKNIGYTYQMANKWQNIFPRVAKYSQNVNIPMLENTSCQYCQYWSLYR